MQPSIRVLIAQKDYEALRNRLAADPQLANEPVPLGDDDPRSAHPLHRICDHVMSGVYSDDDAVELAKLFLEYGANVNGYELNEKRDTPLIAAASLHAEKTGILYIERGANIHHPGAHGGTALHWAAWVGRDKLVKRLIEGGADIHKRCIDFTSTPLFWAVHGYKNGGDVNRHQQVECVRLLLQAGADKTVPSAKGYMPIQILDATDKEMIALLQ